MKSFLVLVFCAAVGTAMSEDVNDTDVRISGGSLVSIEKFPHQVSILSSENEYHCGGSIIGHEYVLTAASCYKKGVSTFIRAGSSKTFSGGSIHRVVKVMKHKDFKDREYKRDNDIAILKVTPAFTFDHKRKAITLWPEEFELDDQRVQISGFGATSSGGEKSRNLRSVTVPIISRARCDRLYDNSYYSKISESRFCTGCSPGGKGSCDGDEGSAVVFEKKQVGIVSVSRGCGRPDTPGINTNIAHHLDWIHQTIGKMCIEHKEDVCDCNDDRNLDDFCECELEVRPRFMDLRSTADE